MAVIYLVDGGPNAAAMIKNLLTLAGPGRQSEISYGTLPSRVLVPDDIYGLHCGSKSGAGNPPEPNEKDKKQGDANREASSAPPPESRLEPAGKPTKKATRGSVIR